MTSAITSPTLPIQPTGVSLKGLPPEILGMIWRLLSKKTYKNMRLVCKELEQVATPFVFEKIFMSTTRTEMENAKNIACHFARHVKTITLSFRRFFHPSADAYLTAGMYIPSAGSPQSTDDHVNHASQAYRKARDDHDELIKSGDFVKQLREILRKSSCARKLAFEDSGRGESDQFLCIWHRRFWTNANLCPYDQCHLTTGQHLRYYREPEYAYRVANPSPWHSVMLALSEAKSPITEIVSFPPRGGFLPMGMFATTPRRALLVAERFSLLTKLRLDLSCENTFDQRDDDSYVSNGSVAQALSAAVNLRTLCIETNDPPISSLISPDGPVIGTWCSAVLGGCRFPELRSLAVEHFNGTQNELVDFLRACPRVEKLAFQFFELYDGQWASVMASLQAMLRLTSVTLDALDGGFPECESWDIYFLLELGHQVIEDFFVRGGENPFTKEGMDHFRSNHVRDQQSEDDEAKTKRRLELAFYT